MSHDKALLSIQNITKIYSWRPVLPERILQLPMYLDHVSGRAGDFDLGRRERQRQDHPGENGAAPCGTNFRPHSVKGRNIIGIRNRKEQMEFCRISNPYFKIP